MTPVGGLVAVHAHPDDESLSTGALLATWAGAGRPVTVVTCTRGERGEVIGADLAHLEGDGPALAAHREGELARALAALGVRDHVFLDRVGDGTDRYEDSGMAWLGTGRAGSAADVPPRAFVAVPVDVAAARLARVLRDRRPEVVVTYEPAGGYGHPDHVHAHRVTERALALAATEPDDDHPPHRVLTVLWAAQQEDTLRRAYRALAPTASIADATRGGRLLTAPDPDGDLPSVAAPAVDVEVAVLPVRDAVLAALRAHGTQVQAVEAVDGDDALVGRHALSNDVLAPLLPSEGYRLAHGTTSTLTGVAGIRPVA